MTTETLDRRYQDLDTWPLARSIEAIIEANFRAVEAVKGALLALERAAEGLERRLLEGGRLVYAGAGTSGRLALLDAAELGPTFGFDDSLVLLAGGGEAWDQAKEGAEDDEAAAIEEIDAAAITHKDAVVAVAASGSTPYTVAAARRARERGAFTVGIANNPGRLLETCEVAILLNTGPEVLAGSTRLAAGTAQKVALNALSTAVLVRLGGAYGNLMVGMRPVNKKLKRRAVSIVAEATGYSLEEAEEALEIADWRIREAIVMIKTHCSLEEVRRRLEASRQRVREAL